MRLIQAAFLDFDGVILESIDVKAWAFKKLFEGYPEHVDQIVSYHMEHGGVSRYIKFRYIYEHILKEPLTEEQFQDLCDQYSDLVFDRVLNCEFVKGAKEFLDKYYRQIPLFVVSGTPQEEMQDIIEQKNLSRYFQGVMGSPNSKDYWVKKTLRDHQFSAGQTIFVGDAKSDHEAAMHNGCIFFARVPEAEKDIFKGEKVHHRIRDLKELDLILEKDYLERE